MATTATGNVFSNPIRRILKVIQMEKNEISSVYFYAILQGLINLSLPLGIQTIISFVLGGEMRTSLVVLIVLVVLGVFVGGLLQVNQMRQIEKVQQKIFVRYAFEFAERIPKISLPAVDQYHLPELVNRFFDTVGLQKGISKLLLDIPAATIQIFVGLVLLSFYHPVFIVFGITLLVIILFLLKVTSARGMESSLRESDYKYGVVSWLEEMARVVKSFKFSRNTSLNIERTDELLQGYVLHRTRHFRVLQVQYWSLIAFKILITASMLIVGSILLIDQQLNIGQFIAAEIVILLVISSVEKLIVNLDNVYDVLTAVEKLGKLTDKELEKSGEVILQPSSNGLSLEFNQVSFRYQPDEAPVLQGIQLNIPANQKVCIMGRAGSGKSSLLRLMTGGYPDFEGSILVNNLPITNYKLNSLRAEMGLLFSQQDIFDGTLLENICMGSEVRDLNPIFELAERVGLKQYISQLPEGFNSQLDPTGRRLPRKVVQKILLLRALVNTPKLLLLEDPFEGMEEVPRRNIIRYLLEETPKQTILVSSNDIAFASRCDWVIFLEEGKVKAMGKWLDIEHIIKA